MSNTNKQASVDFDTIVDGAQLSPKARGWSKRWDPLLGVIASRGRSKNKESISICWDLFQEGADRPFCHERADGSGRWMTLAELGEL